MKSDILQSVVMVKGTLVLPETVAEGAVIIKAGIIAEVLIGAEQIQSWLAHSDHKEGQAIRDSGENVDSYRHHELEIIEADGCYLLPGLIDVHCDAIEKEVQPRPNTLFPLGMSLLEFERKLPLHGITTMYHSLSLGVGLSLRGEHLLTQMVELIRSYREQRSVVRNRIHLRYEISYLPGLPIVKRYVDEGAIDYLSFMDHSPGQGQYREPGSFERYVMKNQSVSVDEVRTIVEELMENRRQIDWPGLEELGRLAVQRGISVASHDDDSSLRVDQLRGCGVSVSEFPITLETAVYAVQQGLHVCVGAPNIVRGGSHDKNLSAVEAIAAGAADIICSDYHPSALLNAIFKLADEGITTLPAAVRTATLAPAEALGIASEVGTLERGKAADLIIVDRYEGHPWVKRTIVGGKTVYTALTR
ncbi:alpha-D-ribose 1-methylphosphonate 5-triphosphate diphosphatase [Paenibacillus sp. KS-LC4]|uniref:alpha-D-ribose 1-methylphosphonate 5-triphosphate diphosphatase n=1 Tax=Paenibacillus sp. KS-LC4 TaxID=2979727 RepID=UPI0030D11008